MKLRIHQCTAAFPLLIAVVPKVLVLGPPRSAGCAAGRAPVAKRGAPSVRENSEATPPWRWTDKLPNLHLIGTYATCTLCVMRRTWFLRCYRLPGYIWSWSGVSNSRQTWSGISLQQCDSTCAFSESCVTWAWRGWYPSHRLRAKRWLIRHNATIQILPVFSQLVGCHHNPHPCNHPPSRTHKQSSLSNDSWRKRTHTLWAQNAMTTHAASISHIDSSAMKGSSGCSALLGDRSPNECSNSFLILLKHLPWAENWNYLFYVVLSKIDQLRRHPVFWEVWISAINAKPFAFPWSHWLGRNCWMSDGIAFHHIGKWEVTCKHQYLKGGYY